MTGQCATPNCGGKLQAWPYGLSFCVVCGYHENRRIEDRRMSNEERIFQELQEIKKRLIKMEERIMAELDDLNAAEATEQSDITALIAAQTKAFADLEAAATASAPNLLPIIAQLQTNHTALATALAAAQAADATVTPAPVAPTTPA
jgi:hypothetical protein